MASPDAASTPDSPAGERAGHYELFARLGAGSLTTAHLGRRLGASGFGVAVVVKRLLPALAHD
ncbi:MAG TPA: hypothetical protein VFS00_24365, partial [Polyangiaceae bacterium]|nr:hypothetical protein [Polyangiaceae bacterium]